MVINIGETRADAFAKKIEASTEQYCRLEVQSSQLLPLFSHSDFPSQYL